MELDLRLLKVSIEVNGKIKAYQGLNIIASGTKFANANQNECEIKISNVDKATQDYILTETSPFNKNKTPKRAIVEAGRVSYGTTRVYIGNVISAVPSQPPDITLTLKCLTGNFQSGNIVSRSKAGQAPLSAIASDVANDLGLALNFQAQDKQIANYSYSGGALKQVDGLGQLGDINAYVDDETLIVKNSNSPLSNKIKLVNLETGLIGIPEVTKFGVKVKFLFDNQTTLGGLLRLVSKIYPAINGDYIIYKLGFELTYRSEPFYWVAEAKRL